MEMMDVVNEQDEIINTVSQPEIYEKKLTHRIVHVFVLNPENGKIYLQKRSDMKSYLPGYYCTSAGGHVRSGESYEEAAKRELQEEIGLTTQLEKIGSMNFILNEQNRFIDLFVTYANEGFNFTDGEVAGGRFFGVLEVDTLIKSGKKIHPQLEHCYNWIKENKPELLKHEKMV